MHYASWATTRIAAAAHLRRAVETAATVAVRDQRRRPGGGPRLGCLAGCPCPCPRKTEDRIERVSRDCLVAGVNVRSADTRAKVPCAPHRLILMHAARRRARASPGTMHLTCDPGSGEFF